MRDINRIYKDSSTDTNMMKRKSDGEVRRLMTTMYGGLRDIKDRDMDDPIVAEFCDRAKRGR